MIYQNQELKNLSNFINFRRDNDHTSKAKNDRININLDSSKPLSIDFKNNATYSEKRAINRSPPEFGYSIVSSVSFSDYRNELRDMQSQLESLEKKISKKIYLYRYLPK